MADHSRFITQCRRTARFLLAVFALATSAALAGCATANIEGPGGSASIATNKPVVLTAQSPELAGKEVIALPRPRSARAFDFNAPFLAGSSQPAPPAPPRAPVERTETNLYDVVSVYWGTDRKLDQPAADPTIARTDTGRITTGSISTIDPPGAERGTELLLGRARVTVPKVAREKGELRRPRQLTFLKYTLYREDEDPRKHFTLGRLERMDANDFITASNEHMSKATRFQNEAFIFVHGFNISFEDALYRTAQIAYDLEFDSVPYLYSWPSKAEKSGYLYDRDSADRAPRYFLDFLELVASQTNAKRIHIIAHSLGARPMLEALDDASKTPGRLAKLKLGEVILAAPDIDRDNFAEIAGVLTRRGPHTTLYASANDRPLQISRLLARGKPRTGEVTSNGPQIVKNIDTIDISQAGTDALIALNHNTYAKSSDLLADMRILFRKSLRPPGKRSDNFAAIKTAAGTYWKFTRIATARQ